MSLKEKLKKHQYNEIWQQYCGFLDLSMEGYMKIQRRLMEEQIQLWSNCGLGQSILKGKHPKNLEEFRKMVPLTEYEDYADILLTKQPDMLPGNPVIWIQTTWEGGKHPIKVAPYTRSMLDTYRNNVMACLILSTSREKGSFDVASTDKFLYALAPLPYATGLFPLALGEEIDIEFLPAIKDAVNMSFSERNKLGFKMAMQKDLGFFFGLGSVAYAVSLSLSSLTSSGGGVKLSSLLKCKPQMIIRLLKAKYRCKKEQRQLLPKDLFHLKGFMVAGTDNLCYKDDLEELWGIRPMELFAQSSYLIIIFADVSQLSVFGVIPPYIFLCTTDLGQVDLHRTTGIVVYHQIIISPSGYGTVITFTVYSGNHTLIGNALEIGNTQHQTLQIFHLIVSGIFQCIHPCLFRTVCPKSTDHSGFNELHNIVMTISMPE